MIWFKSIQIVHATSGNQTQSQICYIGGPAVEILDKEILKKRLTLVKTGIFNIIFVEEYSFVQICVCRQTWNKNGTRAKNEVRLSYH